MATAIGVTPPTSSDEENDALPTETDDEDINKLRLNKMLPLSQEVLLDEFHDNETFPFSRDPEELTKQLLQKKTEIDELLRKKQLNQVQYDLLLPPNGKFVDSKKWDVTLLIRLLLTFCGYEYPEKNWIPSATDTDKFANMIRVKRCRDDLQHRMRVSDSEFNRLFQLFKDPLVALGMPEERIDNILTMKVIDKETRCDIFKRFALSFFLIEPYFLISPYQLKLIYKVRSLSAPTCLTIKIIYINISILFPGKITLSLLLFDT